MALVNNNIWSIGKDAEKMANIIYMTIDGEKQGNISEGCCSVDSVGNKFQSGHENEIFVYEMIGNLSRQQHAVHHPVEIRKSIDKSTPLIAHALSSNEKLTVGITFYRTSMSGGIELFFKVKLTGARLSDARIYFPNSLTHNDVQPYESISIQYESITWDHVMAGTSSYSIWSDRVY